MGKQEFDALFSEEPDGGLYYYANPALKCECGSIIWLPYGSLPEMDSGGRQLEGTDPFELPPGEWSQVFGCIRCGQIATYAGNQVQMFHVQKRSKSIYHEHADVWLVVFPCGNEGCGSPQSVHLGMREYHTKPNTADADDAIFALRKEFLGQRLACRHDLKAIPAKFYHAERVTKRMW